MWGNHHRRANDNRTEGIIHAVTELLHKLSYEESFQSCHVSEYVTYTQVYHNYEADDPPSFVPYTGPYQSNPTGCEAGLPHAHLHYSILQYECMCIALHCIFQLSTILSDLASGLWIMS